MRQTIACFCLGVSFSATLFMVIFLFSGMKTPASVEAVAAMVFLAAYVVLRRKETP